MPSRAIALALLLVLLPMLLGADEARLPKLVVLELKVNGKAISLDVAMTLTGMIRQRMVKAIGSRAKMLSKEKVFEILKQAGKSAVQCTGECEVQTAREAGADYAVTGDVNPLGNKAVLVLEIKRSRDGVTVASERLKASPADMDANLDATVDALAAAWLSTFDGAAAAPADRPRVEPKISTGGKLTEGKGVAAGDAGQDYDLAELEQAEALKKAIDAAKAAQADDQRSPEQKAAAWDAVAKLSIKGKNPYREEAEKHAQEWRELAGARTRMAADWDKLQRMLRLEVVPIGDKKKAVGRFLAAYAALANEAAVQGAKAAQVALDQGKALPLGGDAPAGMVLIPAGTFWMGCNSAKDKDCQEDEKPQHKVTLSAYYMDLTETTVAQYKACVDAGVCTAPSTQSPATYATYPSFPNNPVNNVTWTQSQAYCKWRGAGFDLPTEAQWEMAARGSCEKNGSTAGDAGCKAAMRTYPWGETAPTASYAVMSGSGSTAAVGSKPVGDSPYGLHDMAGNVWEWNRDWYSATYSAEAVTDPVGPGSASYRVNRGGSFGNDAAYLRAGFRGYDYPSVAIIIIGLRCMRSSP